MQHFLNHILSLNLKRRFQSMISFPGLFELKGLDSLCIVCVSCCLKYSVMGPQYITHGRKMTLPPDLLRLCAGLIHSS